MMKSNIQNFKASAELTSNAPCAGVQLDSIVCAVSKVCVGVVFPASCMPSLLLLAAPTAHVAGWPLLSCELRCMLRCLLAKLSQMALLLAPKAGGKQQHSRLLLLGVVCNSRGLSCCCC